MSSDNTHFEGGAILPPSSEDYRQMWENQAKQLKPNEYQRQAEENKRKARKEIFQEQVRKAVEVKDPRLPDLFHSVIDIEERR
jgi:hypothetical protein